MSLKSDRPLSPHLLIYKPQMTSMLSILHRATGAALALGVTLLAVWVACAAYSAEAYDFFIAACTAPLGLLVLAGISYCYIYHLFNGLRHLFWDSGLLFKIENATLAGYIVFYSSLLVTGALWAVILIKMGVLPWA